jgi:hypothetical protein
MAMGCLQEFFKKIAPVQSVWEVLGWSKFNFLYCYLSKHLITCMKFVKQNFPLFNLKMYSFIVWLLTSTKKHIRKMMFSRDFDGNRIVSCQGGHYKWLDNPGLVQRPFFWLLLWGLTTVPTMMEAQFSWNTPLFELITLSQETKKRWGRSMEWDWIKWKTSTYFSRMKPLEPRDLWEKERVWVKRIPFHSAFLDKEC